MSTSGKDLEQEIKVGQRQLVITEWMSELLHLALMLKELNVSADKRVVLLNIIADLNAVKTNLQYKLNILERSIKQELTELQFHLFDAEVAKEEIKKSIGNIEAAFRKN